MSYISDLLRNHGVDLSWQEAVYQDLHEHPELSGFEMETSRTILTQLKRFDCEIISPLGGYGVVAIFRNGDHENHPVALMRADFDGLPVKETTGLPWASTRVRPLNGNNVPVMHACGHDMHTTALLGACALLDERRDAWEGTFIALFQPSEENARGANAMVADGLVDKIPRPDVCFGQHVVPGPAGAVMSMPGAALAACDSIDIRIQGRSAHGSMPHNSIDPTYVAAMIVVRLQGIVGREVSPEDFAVVSVGTLQSGNSNNTIPSEARLVLNCRFYNDTVKKKVYRAIERVVRGECLASGIEHEPVIEYFAHGELTDNDVEVFARVRPTFDEVFGPASFTGDRWTASEDFPNIPMALNSPYLYWTIGATPAGDWARAVAADRVAQDVPANHMGDFVPDFEPTVSAATTAAAAAVLTYLGATKRSGPQ
ncbi:putative hydrolase YxeP [Corynebacterium faecale]|uniref:amidohydrolase n=1 Tax=Corynebacterium faecale TaxID=1758466 RepID=UPI0025B4C7C8|nr:amidohydrolase [Corynebacterium faecale]WJY92620.1 putative hydrolase YxeP [Corynebacterium faecale]